MNGGTLLNAGGTGTGGGGTYVVAVARELARGGPRDLRWRFLASPELAEHLREAPVAVATLPAMGAARRTAWEQIALARPHGEQLVAAGGFGPLARPGSFLLVAHNALHYAPHGVGGRAGLRLAAESALARASSWRARSVVVPTDAMAGLVQRFSQRTLVAPFGPGLAERRMAAPDGRFRLLHRTGWGPHKNLLTLLQAVRLLADQMPGRFVLRSACDPRTPFAHGFANSGPERVLLRDPLVAAHVELAGYSLASEESRVLAGDAVVVPSGTESFSFPLAEGLALGLPIVAADRPYARELCGEAAVYVPCGRPEPLAAAIERLVEGARPPPPTAAVVRRLSWERHVDALAAAVRAA